MGGASSPCSFELGLGNAAQMKRSTVYSMHLRCGVRSCRERHLKERSLVGGWTPEFDRICVHCPTRNLQAFAGICTGMLVVDGIWARSSVCSACWSPTFLL